MKNLFKSIAGFFVKAWEFVKSLATKTVEFLKTEVVINLTEEKTFKTTKGGCLLIGLALMVLMVPAVKLFIRYWSLVLWLIIWEIASTTLYVVIGLIVLEMGRLVVTKPTSSTIIEQ